MRWLQCWNGSFLQKTSLRALGLRVQMGHPPGQVCPYRVVSQELFTVLHTNGIHRVAVDFCNCSPTIEPRVQCMCHRWWPASTKEPRSAATFTLLKQFHILSLQGKLAVYDYYKSLEIMTDGSSLDDIPVSFILSTYQPFHVLSGPKFRLPQLSLMVRQYRHVKMLARAGRGHDPAGVSATKPGEIAVKCRACPQPGVNLPEGWETDTDNACVLSFLRLQLQSHSIW